MSLAESDVEEVSISEMELRESSDGPFPPKTGHVRRLIPGAEAGGGHICGGLVDGCSYKKFKLKWTRGCSRDSMGFWK
jgi:hypothetical protein